MSSFNLQRFVMYGSKTLPSVTLFGFVVAQVVFDALGMFPSPALQSWIERNRVELKTLLDRDYRLDHRELEAIRQQLSDTEAGNGSSHSTYYPSRPSSSSSISPTHSPSYNYHINEQRIQALSAELDNRNRALEEQQESLEHTESQLLTATGDLVTLKNQVAYLVKEGDGQSAKIRELEQEILGVQGRYDTIVDERDTLQQSLAETKAQKAELEKEIADLRSQIDNVTAELTQAQEDSQSAQKKYTEEIAALNATIEQVKDLHNKDLEMFTSNVQHLEKDFQSLTARNESLYKQLGDAEIGLKAAAEKQTELERTIEVGETEKKAFQAKEASLNDQVADQTRELEGLKATVAGLETALRTSGDKVDSLETELVEVKRLKEDLETEIVELKKTIAEKQSQADSARNRLTMTRALSGWWSGPSTAAAAA